MTSKDDIKIEFNEQIMCHEEGERQKSQQKR
jgi:hypothetical protein